jgi:hypothetical protein
MLVYVRYVHCGVVGVCLLIRRLSRPFFLVFWGGFILGKYEFGTNRARCILEDGSLLCDEDLLVDKKQLSDYLVYLYHCVPAHAIEHRFKYKENPCR